jgi:hypothetical protein
MSHCVRDVFGAIEIKEFASGADCYMGVANKLYLSQAFSCAT